MALSNQERASYVITMHSHLSRWIAPITTNQQTNDIVSRPFTTCRAVKREGVSGSKAHAYVYPLHWVELKLMNIIFANQEKYLNITFRST
jgi:hypothetical protein